MQRFIARIMATLMLLSVFGQAAAQPCAEMSAPTMAKATVMDIDSDIDIQAGHHQAVDSAQTSAHCGDMPTAPSPSGTDRCTQSSDTGVNTTGGLCSASCTCCPSHCATVLPPVETAGIPMPRTSLQVTYRDLASSAEPESLIKPPRSA
ncbi:hypothetical protein [Microbulbifer sp. HZ11]|uniref:hypothetical protein n=1 Tax=Microbulbifer sp. HZ11 TaxID=1453501 RepID=UPI0012DD0CB4|nr:hypothetical protein [Microbulbifer sp. HZ11]